MTTLETVSEERLAQLRLHYFGLSSKLAIDVFNALTELTDRRASTEAEKVTDAARDVLSERRRQVEGEGWTPEHDDSHDAGQMARAAACYAISASSEPDDQIAAVIVDSTWPWAPEWWKPVHSRRDLIKAGALILAEIERLDRAALTSEQSK